MQHNYTITELDAIDYDQFSLALRLIVAYPEYFNLIILLLGMYGMYQGVEIQHPLYSVLLVNLIVSWFPSILNCIAFALLLTLLYLKFTVSGSAIVFYFHCICWLLTNIIRHVYIVHDVWLHKIVPNVKVQCGIAVSSAFTMTLLLASPTFAYVFYKGSIFELINNTVCLSVSALEKWGSHIGRFPKLFGYYLFIWAHPLCSAVV
jgi:hypothetical protein